MRRGARRLPKIVQVPSTVQRIVIFRALFLGDLLCATPAFRALRERFPAAEITLIGLPWAAEFVGRISSIDRLLVFPGYTGIAEVPYQAERAEAFLAQAHATGYDLAIQMHGDGHISNGFVAGLGARLSLGYCCGVDGRLDITLPYESDEHETKRWLRLVGVLGATTQEMQLEFPVTTDEQKSASELLVRRETSGPLIGLHAGAKDEARRWPPRCFAALADALIEQFDAQIVLTGGEGEQSLTAAVRAAMRHDALDLAGRTDLGTFAALISQLDLLVTNDTGASHLASASATPSVVLFGPTRPECWAPLNTGLHRVIDAPVVLGQADRMTALQQLPVQPVLAAAAESLQRRKVSVDKRGPVAASRPLALGS